MLPTAFQKEQEQILASAVLSGQGSQAGRQGWLRNCTAPALCQPQPPVLQLPPGLWLAQHLAHPSLTTACATRPPPEQSLNVPVLVALLCSYLGQMALKQLIFKRGFYCQISKLFTSRRQSAAFPRAAAAAFQIVIHICLLANSLPSCHRHVTWWHSPKHRLTPQRSMPTGFSGTKNQPQCSRKLDVRLNVSLKEDFLKSAWWQDVHWRWELLYEVRADHDPVSDSDQHCHFQRSM